MILVSEPPAGRPGATTAPTSTPSPAKVGDTQRRRRARSKKCGRGARSGLAGGPRPARPMAKQHGLIHTGVVPSLLASAGNQGGRSLLLGLGSPQRFRWRAGTSFQSLADPPLDPERRRTARQLRQPVELIGFSQPPCDGGCPSLSSRPPRAATGRLQAQRHPLGPNLTTSGANPPINVWLLTTTRPSAGHRRASFSANCR